MYKQATVIVDQKMEGAVRSSGVDTNQMTTSQLSAFMEKIQAERAYKIEGLATIMLLDSWYRRVCCLSAYVHHICAYAVVLPSYSFLSGVYISSSSGC